MSFFRRSRIYFNPRTHGGCDPHGRGSAVDQSYFNPRTHGGCDNRFEKKQTNDLISIHAPTGGATLLTVRDRLTRRYFNPRTHGGCDSDAHPNGVRRKNFNPRTHGGCDSLRAANMSSLSISIHAPTGGATCWKYYQSTIKIYFNPRTHGGCDWHGTLRNLTELVFQSTHPRGVRPVLIGHR